MTRPPPLQPPFQSIDEPATSIPATSIPIEMDGLMPQSQSIPSIDDRLSHQSKRMDWCINPNASHRLMIGWKDWLVNANPFPGLMTGYHHTNRNGWIGIAASIHPIDRWMVNRMVITIPIEMNGLICQSQSIPSIEWLNRNGWIDASIPIHPMDWRSVTTIPIELDGLMHQSQSIQSIDDRLLPYQLKGWIDVSIHIHPIDWWSVTTIPIERMDWSVNPNPSNRLKIGEHHINWNAWIDVPIPIHPIDWWSVGYLHTNGLMHQCQSIHFHWFPPYESMPIPKDALTGSCNRRRSIRILPSHMAWRQHLKLVFLLNSNSYHHVYPAQS